MSLEMVGSNVEYTQFVGKTKNTQNHAYGPLKK